MAPVASLFSPPPLHLHRLLCCVSNSFMASGPLHSLLPSARDALPPAPYRACSLGSFRTFLEITFTGRPSLASWKLPLPSHSSFFSPSFFSIALTIMGVCRFYLSSSVSSPASGRRVVFCFAHCWVPVSGAGQGSQ